MIKLSINRIIALAALAVTLCIAVATMAQPQQPQPQSTSCATARVALTSATPKAGDELTATVSIENCATEKERFTVKYSYTDPCGETTQMGNVAVKLAAGESKPEQITFLAPAAPAGCAGNFKVNGTIIADGKEVTTASAPFSVRAQ